MYVVPDKRLLEMLIQFTPTSSACNSLTKTAPCL